MVIFARFEERGLGNHKLHMINLLVNTIDEDIRKSWSQKKKYSGLTAFSFRENLPVLSKSQRKFIQTIPRVNHGPLKNKTAETYNPQATPSNRSPSLPATRQLIYLATHCWHSAFVFPTSAALG